MADNRDYLSQRDKWVITGTSPRMKGSHDCSQDTQTSPSRKPNNKLKLKESNFYYYRLCILIMKIEGLNFMIITPS